MNWNNVQEREQFSQVAAAAAVKATTDRTARLVSAIRSTVHTGSPIEAMFAVWFTAARDHMLAEGHVRFALALKPQVWLDANGQAYRLDFALAAQDAWLAQALASAHLEVRVGVELDGHDYHERTKAQVIDRNQRDRDLTAAGWRMLHFSGTELYRNPMVAVVEVLVAGADALDEAKAALLHA